MELGADWIETDIRQTRDGVLVCFHDETLSRTTNGKGRIINTSYKKLKELDAGSWYNEAFKGETIPSLNEALQLINGKSVLLIELKGSLMLQWGFLVNLKRLIDKHNAWNWVVIQSFNRPMLVRLRQIDKRFRVFHLINFRSKTLPLFLDRVPRFGNPADSNLAEAVNPSFKLLKSSTVRNFQRKGKKVMVWTVNEIEEMETLLRWKVDGIITNYPDRLAALLNSNSTP